MARRVLLVVGLGLIGVLAAASIGYAAYLVSRDSVGLPVTKLEPSQEKLVPPPPTASTPTTTVPRSIETTDDRSGSRGGTGTVETGEDNSGRGRGRGRGRSGGDNSGSGSDNSGSGSGGDDFDDD